VILDSFSVDAEQFERRTGWAVKPQGACKGEVCVPLPPSVRQNDGSLDVRVLAHRLGMPLVEDDANAVRALGPESGLTGRALTTAVAPDLELPEVNGNPFRLSSLIGQKVLLVAWASW
jgi:hypothetical protein